MALVYTLCYGFLLLKTDGLPYVMDNNESFSSLWHAANLYQFGVAQSYGLADEAFSPHEAAHPYVHTHQGNFPRLFAFLIYTLGARTIEAQITVTTLVVGLAAIIVLYLFFARIATPAFGALVAAVFMTDYVLFAQWQVVTYRVWHGLLLFLCLYAVDRAIEERARRWLVVTAVTFACLFYYELVFGAFVAAWCGAYALVRSATRPWRLVAVGAAATAGMVVALSAVIAQVIGYLGFEDFRRDIYLTFAARNDFSSVASLFAEAARFYESKRVVFWHNLQDREGFSGLWAFFRSFTAFDWRIHTPLFAVTIWILAAAGLFALRSPRTKWQRVLVASTCLGLFFAAVVLGVLIERPVFDGRYAPLWRSLYEPFGSETVLVFAPFAAALVAIYLAGSQAGGLAREAYARVRGVLILLMCGLCAYALVYFISPGYVFSGYLYRHAPFTVFLTDVVVALGIYAAILAAVQLTRRAIAFERASAAALYLRASFAGLAVLLVVFLCSYWLIMQVTYIALMPPNHYAFLKKLAEPPYRGASFVVNNYAAPVAAYTGQWAYLDHAIAQANLVKAGGGTYLEGDKKYLWFADRDVNQNYRKPDYFVCMTAQGPHSIVNRILQETGRGPGPPGCSQLPLVRRAKDLELEGVRLVEHDDAGHNRRGFDSWAIVKLDWKESVVEAIDWTFKPIRQTAADPAKTSWRSNADERLNKNAIIFHVPVRPEVGKYLELLTAPGYAALALENNGLYVSQSSKLTVVNRESVRTSTGYLRYVGKKGDVYAYEVGIQISAGVEASELSFPVEVDISRLDSGVAVIRTYPPLARLLPEEPIQRVESKLQSLAGLESQRRMIEYLDRLSADGRGFQGILEAIALESHNRLGGSSDGDSEYRGDLSKQATFLAVLAIWLIGFPLFLLAARSHRLTRPTPDDRA